MVGLKGFAGFGRISASLEGFTAETQQNLKVFQMTSSEIDLLLGGLSVLIVIRHVLIVMRYI